MPSTTFTYGAIISAILALTTSGVDAQPNAIDSELKQLSGHWRISDMFENGTAIPADQMRQSLPGGGILEIVDTTILFKSPLDGVKSTRTFRLDPTTYPKKIVIMERDQITGVGIYKFDQGKLVICVSNDPAKVPTEFNAGPDSGRSLMVMGRFDPGQSELPGRTAASLPKRPIPPAPPVQQTPPAQPAPAQPAPAPVPAPAQPVPAAAQPAPTPIVADNVAGRVLTDTQVRAMAVGTWRVNDLEGSIDIVMNSNGVFRTFRYLKTISNFHVVFVPTPVSSGNWSVNNGRLAMNVTSSSRIDKVNQYFNLAVRSVSATDMLLVDHIGRVTRAVKTQ